MTSRPLPPTLLEPVDLEAHDRPLLVVDLDHVTRREPVQVPEEAVPRTTSRSERVYGATERAELRVPPCGGEFDQQRGSHVDDLITFAVRSD